MLSLIDASVETPAAERASPAQAVAGLAAKIRALETAGRRPRAERVYSSGCAVLDAALPEGGYAAGTMVEWLEPRAGAGGMSLALAAARSTLRDGRRVMVIDPSHSFYPPAAEAMGIPLSQLIVVHPTRDEDVAWSIDQALRCPAIGAVVARLAELSELSARRFQLAVEAGGGLGLWLRPWAARGRPSWSEIQWWVAPQAEPRSESGPARGGPTAAHRSLALQLLRCRGRQSHAAWRVTLDTLRGTLAAEKRYADSSPLPLAAQLAMPKTAGRALAAAVGRAG